MLKNSRNILYALILLFVLVISFFKWGVGLYVDWLWFQSLGYASVFYTVLLSDLGLRTAAVILIFTILLLNLMFTRKSLITAISTPRTVEDDDGVISINQSPLGSFITPKHVTTIFILLSLALAIFVSSALRESWIVLQNYLNATLFNLNDPIFSKDVGFYTFQLPFYNLIYQLLTWSIILSALVVAAIYFFIDSSRGNNKIFSSELSRLHISALAAVFFIVKAWGYKLQQYGLLFSDSGVIFGASYTDVHARLLGLNILMVIAIITAIVILVSIYTRRFRFILHSIGALVAASILVGVAYPLAIQNFVVSPNELARERPYIENSIMFTRYAYNLDRIDKRPFPAGRVLTREQIDQNPEAINNIRLWDWRPLGETYKQLQEMRPYYDFMNLSIDRYLINGEYRQVMLASREMNQTKLPDRAHTWVNQRLQYTHGYGVAISPVNEVTEEGLPKFFMQNIPPVTNTDLIINRPEIYYGETQDDFVIVNTGVEEFDYPIGGDHNAFTTYQEESGVKINSLIRKALLALYFNDYRMLISSDIEYDSQVLFKRNIRERVSHVAPFLKYDGDPYLVLNQGNGRLQWIWDAYTITNMFPYSEPFNGRDNYIRNAVKVVIDAYNGDVTFYVSDPSDPIIQTYQKIFPELFTHIDNMDQELINHLRYPVDLFEIQANKFILYHMTDPVNFYSKEDKWQIPNEQYFGNIQRMEPYYVITKLPGQEEPEFVLIIPFTPNDRQNMIAWLAGRADGDNYGDLICYTFPKEELVYGPMQIEARIDQNTIISEQLTLWDQAGSRVIRGNLLVIPIEDSLIYVEPLFLQSENTSMPELRRVIMSHGDRLVMEPTIEAAIKQIFGEGASSEIPEETAMSPTEDQLPGEMQSVSTTELIRDANKFYNEAQNHLKEGNWAAYGRSMDELRNVLQKLSDQS